MSTAGKRAAEDGGGTGQPPPTKQRSVPEEPLPRACFSCYTSKIKCDRATPCGRCRRLGLACLPNPGVPRRRSSQKVRSLAPVKSESPASLHSSSSPGAGSAYNRAGSAQESSNLANTPFVIPRGPPEISVQAGTSDARQSMWQATYLRLHGRQDVPCSAVTQPSPLVLPAHQQQLPLMPSTGPQWYQQQQSVAPSTLAVFRPPPCPQAVLNLPVDHLRRYAGVSAAPPHHQQQQQACPNQQPEQRQPGQQQYLQPHQQVALHSGGSTQPHGFSVPLSSFAPQRPPSTSAASSMGGDDSQDEEEEEQEEEQKEADGEGFDSPFAEAIQGLIDTHGNLCPVRGVDSHTLRTPLPPLLLPPSTVQATNHGAAEQAGGAVIFGAAALTMPHGRPSRQVRPPRSQLTALPMGDSLRPASPAHAQPQRLRPTPLQIYPHLLMPPQLPPRPPPPMALAVPPPPHDLEQVVFDDALQPLNSHNPESKAQEAIDSGDHLTLGPSPQDLARFVSGWDPETVLQDKSKAVLRSWRLWNLAQDVDTTHGLLSALSTALGLDEEAKLWERQYVLPPRAMLEAGTRAIQKRMEPLWALGPGNAVCAVAMSGNLMHVHTNERFEALYWNATTLQEALITERIQPFHYWARLMRTEESAQSLYHVAIEAAFRGNPSVTSDHPLEVVDRFKQRSSSLCTVGIHASHDGVHCLTWIVLTPPSQQATVNSTHGHTDEP